MDFFNNTIRKHIASVTKLDENFTFDQFKVGRSNITFKIEDGTYKYVLRRPPFGNKLESAHNMQREYRIISELSKSKIKVPNPIALCTDRDISDEDFYIMEYVDGQTISDNVVAEAYSKDAKEKISILLLKQQLNYIITM